MRLFGFAEIEIAEQPPQADREVAHQGLLDLAEPADELGRQPPRNAVGEEEIDILLRQQAPDLRADRHGFVKRSGYTAIRCNGRRPLWPSTGSALRRWRPRC